MAKFREEGPQAADDPQISKTTRIRRFRIGLGLTLGVFTTLAVAVVQIQWPSRLPAFVKVVAQLWAGDLNAFFGGVLERITKASPLAGGFLAGFWRGFSFAFVGTWLHDHVFSSPDKQLLHPFPDQSPFDPLWGSGLGLGVDAKEVPLKWVAPIEPGPRLEAWTKLRQFVNEGSFDGRFTIWRRPKERSFHDFRWTMVTGRAGSGKSRMAVELLRELACSDKLDGPDRLSWRKRKGIEWGEWARRTLPAAKRRPSDPWDVGWIKPTTDEGPQEHNRRKTVEKSYINRLGEWAPRRPTALLLDDPLPGDALEIIDTLESQCRHYRFPVRLLIANQTLPGELRFEYAIGPPQNWVSRKAKFYGRVIILGDEAGLTRHDIYRMARGLPEPLNEWEEDQPVVQEHLDRLLEITQGNPMLVELALRLLLQRLPIDHLDAAELVKDRAFRVREHLKLAHISLSDEGLRAVASATIAGPTDTASAVNVGSPRTQRGFQSQIFKHREALRRCFNVLAFESLPAVRPERVGDAFVRLVLSEDCEDAESQDEVAAIAWRLNPRGALRTAERVAAQIDALGRAMRLGPPADVDLSPPDLALAYAVAATCHSFDEPFPADSGRASLAVSCLRTWQLSAEQATGSLSRFTALAAPNQGFTNVCKPAAAIAALNAIGRMLELGLFVSGVDSKTLESVSAIVEPWVNDDLYWDHNPDAVRAYLALEALADKADSRAPL